MDIKKIAFYISIGLGIFLLLSVFGKLSGQAEVIDMLESNHLGDWRIILGLGELLSVFLFILPKTFRLGALLLSAYFGGAIVFHMAHPDPVHQSFVGPSIILLVVWVLAYFRGLRLFES